MSIPYLYKWYVSLTSNLVATFDSSSKTSSEITVFITLKQVHAPVFPYPSSMQWNNFAILNHFNVLGWWLRNKFPSALTLVENGFVEIDTTLGENRQPNSSFTIATVSPCKKTNDLRLLSQLFTPIWDRFVDTDWVDGNDCAEKQLCGRLITIVVNLNVFSSSCVTKILDLSHFSLSIQSVCSWEWSVIISAHWFHIHSAVHKQSQCCVSWEKIPLELISFFFTIFQ